MRCCVAAPSVTPGSHQLTLSCCADAFAGSSLDNQHHRSLARSPPSLGRTLHLPVAVPVPVPVLVSVPAVAPLPMRCSAHFSFPRPLALVSVSLSASCGWSSETLLIQLLPLCSILCQLSWSNSGPPWRKILPGSAFCHQDAYMATLQAFYHRSRE